MLRIENLSFAYGDSEPLLQDVRFDFGDRGIVGIFGISGVGKTTLLKILAGLLYTPTGTVWRGDQDIMRLDKNALYAYRNKAIGFAFQDHHLLGHCTARENIMLPFLFDDSNVDEGWIRHLTEYLSIMHLLDQKVPFEVLEKNHKTFRDTLYQIFKKYPDINIRIFVNRGLGKKTIQIHPTHIENFMKKWRIM